MRTAHCWLVAPVVVLALVTGPILADIAPEPQYGQSLAPRQATAIRMPEETVQITIGLLKAHVRAEFVLENPGDDAQLEVGFPDVVAPSSWHSDQGPEGVSQYKLRDFKATVDGRAIETDYVYTKGRESPAATAEIHARLGKLRAELARATTPEDKQAAQKRLDTATEWAERDREDWACLGWLLWPMSFEAGQTRRVVVTYWVPHRPPYHATWPRPMFFHYVLTTGALWSGPIGHARIEITLAEDVTPEHVSNVKPAGFETTDTGYAWDLRNVEPDEDVRLDLVQYLTPAEAAAAYQAKADEGDAAGKRATATRWRAWVADCQERAGQHEACIETCRKIIAVEREARTTNSSRLPLRVPRDFRSPYEPWECRVVRCYQALDRSDDVQRAAAVAAHALQALIAWTEAQSPGWRFDRGRFEKQLEEMRALAGAGAPDATDGGEE